MVSRAKLPSAIIINNNWLSLSALNPSPQLVAPQVTIRFTFTSPLSLVQPSPSNHPPIVALTVIDAFGDAKRVKVVITLIIRPASLYRGLSLPVVRIENRSFATLAFGLSTVIHQAYESLVLPSLISCPTVEEIIKTVAIGTCDRLTDCVVASASAAARLRWNQRLDCQEPTKLEGLPERPGQCYRYLSERRRRILDISVISSLPKSHHLQRSPPPPSPCLPPPPHRPHLRGPQRARVVIMEAVLQARHYSSSLLWASALYSPIYGTPRLMLKS